MSPTILTAYTDRLSYLPGSQASLYISAPADGEANVQLVRLNRAVGSARDADANPVLPWSAAGRYPVGAQTSCVGSFLSAPLLGWDGQPEAVSLGAYVWLASFDADCLQVVLSVADGADEVVLGVRDSRVVLQGRSAAGTRWSVDQQDLLRPYAWYFLGASVTADGEAKIFVRSCDAFYAPSCESTAQVDRPVLPASPVATVAASHAADIESVGGVVRGRATQHFTGKIEAPFVAAQALGEHEVTELGQGTSVLEVLGGHLLGAWDLALREGDSLNAARSLVPGVADGVLVNVPARGVTGRTWNGQHLSFHTAPEQYAAVQFHVSDLADAGWRPTLTATLPPDLHSGVYGIRVQTADATDTVPIFVVPPPGAERERVTVLLPTFCYLAYANETLFTDVDGLALSDQAISISEADLAHVSDTSFGRSLYDHHPDGSGVMFSSAARPIVNLRHDYVNWLGSLTRLLASDMHLLEWLDRRGVAYDVLTDLDLHLGGAPVLEPAEVVLTGSHPEYYSGEMLSAVREYRDGGGRLMYLGGNGFYWVTGVYSADPLVIEIRRGQAGVRSWESYPGEVTLVSTGEPGGLWRHRGQAPNKLVGNGFAAQGWGRSEPYYLTPAASDPAHAWIFDGVEEDPVGAYGRSMGGAAGDEIDRADQALGTPADAVILASSRGHTNFYQRVIEEVGMNLPDHGGGQQDPEVHADLVYFRTPGGGEVFAAGSISWSAALLDNDCLNGISRITENVLRRFGGFAGSAPPAARNVAR